MYKKRNIIIDVLRFLAALFVVFFHLYGCGTKYDNWYYDLASHGWIGVPVFFVISGYCVTLSANKSVNPTDFIIRRFFRIFPLYWLSLIFTITFLFLRKHIIGVNNIAHIPHNYKEVFFSIFNLTAPFSNISPMNWVYWTLTIEMFFYLVIYFTISFNKKFWIFIIGIVSIGSCFKQLNTYKLLFFLDSWPSFGFGSVLYLFMSFKDINKWLALILLMLNGFGLIFVNHSEDKIEYLSVVLFTSAIIYISERITFKENILSKLGDYSYGIYLLHVPLGIYFLGPFKDNIIKANLIFRVIFDIFIYLLVLVISKSLYYWIEKPAVIFGNKISKKYLSDSKSY